MYTSGSVCFFPDLFVSKISFVYHLTKVKVSNLIHHIHIPSTILSIHLSISSVLSSGACPKKVIFQMFIMVTAEVNLLNHFNIFVEVAHKI